MPLWLICVGLVIALWVAGNALYAEQPVVAGIAAVVAAALVWAIVRSQRARS